MIIMGLYYTQDKYFLLAEFSVRTVNYGPSFFPSIYVALGPYIDGKNEDP